MKLRQLRSLIQEELASMIDPAHDDKILSKQLSFEEMLDMIKRRQVPNPILQKLIDALGQQDE